jgi:cobalamin biosynthesis protein CobT
MPHSTTKKHRPKRPDYRPNAKQRKKEHAKRIETIDKRELMPNTTIPKSLRKERNPTGVLKQETTYISPEESRIRSLQKLLRQIKVLDEKHSAGEKLDDAQLEKLGRLDYVIEELEELLGVDAGESEESIQDDDNEEEEEEEDNDDDDNEDNDDNDDDDNDDNDDNDVGEEKQTTETRLKKDDTKRYRKKMKTK